MTTPTNAAKMSVYVHMIPNAFRDNKAGYGLSDTLTAFTNRLREAHHQHGFDVLVLTEFHRMLSDRQYHTFLIAMREELGMSAYCGYRKNTPMTLQPPYSVFDTGATYITKSNKMAFETIVLTSRPGVTFSRYEVFFDPPTAQRGYPFSNGCVVMHDSQSGTDLVAIHNSLSFGPVSTTSGSARDAHTNQVYQHQVEEFDFLRQYCRLNPTAKVVGDFNITDALAVALEARRPDILDDFVRLPEQAEFICLPGDYIDTSRIVPLHQTPRGIQSASFYRRAHLERMHVIKVVYLVSALSVLGPGWTDAEVAAARFFHPSRIAQEITGWSASEIAGLTLAIEDDGTNDAYRGDHAPFLVCMKS